MSVNAWFRQLTIQLREDLEDFENERLYSPSPLTVRSGPNRTAMLFAPSPSEATLVAKCHVQPFQLSSAQSGCGMSEVACADVIPSFNFL
jgi:hypothetical protein